jgi:hypothetical protein
MSFDNYDTYDFNNYYGPQFEGTISQVMRVGESGPRSDEIELFRVPLEIGKCYEYAESTRSEGIFYSDKRYYTTNPLRYVGRFLGYSFDRNSVDAAIFDLYGEQRVVNFSHTGDTFFNEVACRLPRLPVELTRDIANVSSRATSNYSLNQLERQRNALTTSQIAHDFLHPASRTPSSSSSRSSSRSRRGTRRNGKKKKGHTKKHLKK